MKTVLAAFVVALTAGSAGATVISDVRQLSAPVAAGPFFVSYSGAADRLLAFNVASATDAFAPLYSIDVSIGEDGSILDAGSRDLVLTNTAFQDIALGSLVDVDLSSDTIRLLFSMKDVARDDDEDWSAFALATFGLRGFDPAAGLGVLDADEAMEAEGEIAAAVVPLPATAALMAGALALLGAVRRRRA